VEGAATDVLRLVSVPGVEGLTILTHPAPCVTVVSPLVIHPLTPDEGSWIKPTGERGCYAGGKGARRVRVFGGRRRTRRMFTSVAILMVESRNGTSV